MKGILVRSKTGQALAHQEVDAAITQLGAATGTEPSLELTAVMTEPTAASSSAKKPPQPTPRGKWQQY